MPVVSTFADVSSVFAESQVVTVAFSRNDYPLGEADFYAYGGNNLPEGILSESGSELLEALLDLGWDKGIVDGVDFKVV